MRRAEREGDPWSGHWSLPGGRRNGCDVDVLEVALRELEEECGIRLAREQLSAALPPTMARRRSGPFLLVAPFVFEIEAELPTVLDASEAVGAIWLPQHILLDPTQHSFQRVAGLPAEVWFPAIALPGAPLWGFTYRLLVDWLGVAPGECTRAGFDVAKLILDFLLARGLILRQPWHSTVRRDGDGDEPVQVLTTRLSGVIPAKAVIEDCLAPGGSVAKLNRLEVRSEYIRMYGLAFEEYLIQAVTD